VGARRPTRVKAVRPLEPSSRTGSSEIPARTGPSQKPAGSPRAGRTIETPEYVGLVTYSDANDWNMIGKHAAAEPCHPFFCFAINRMQPMETMAMYALSVSRPQSARRRLVGSSSLPSAQACLKKIYGAPTKLLRRDKRKNKGKPRLHPTPLLQRP